MTFIKVTDKPRLIQTRAGWNGIPASHTAPMWKCLGLINGDAESIHGFTPRQAYDRFMEVKRRRRPILQKLIDWIRNA